MTLKEYGTPKLVVLVGQTDIICSSNNELMDVTQPDSGIWD